MQAIAIPLCATPDTATQGRHKLTLAHTHTHAHTQARRRPRRAAAAAARTPPHAAPHAPRAPAARCRRRRRRRRRVRGVRNAGRRDCGGARGGGGGGEGEARGGGRPPPLARRSANDDAAPPSRPSHPSVVLLPRPSPHPLHPLRSCAATTASAPALAACTRVATARSRAAGWCWCVGWGVWVGRAGGLWREAVAFGLPPTPNPPLPSSSPPTHPPRAWPTSTKS